MMKTLWLFILLFTGCLPSNAESKDLSKTMIYYIPFQFETYEAVTPENIKQKAKYSFELIDTKTESAVLDLISGGKKSSAFDRKRVRFLMVLEKGKRQIIIDAEGNVIEGEAQHSLRAQKFEQLKNLLAKLVKKTTPSGN